MRAPRSRGQQLDLLGGEERAKLHGEAVDEILVGEHRGPVRAAIGVVVELPEMHELVDHPRVGLEVADQLLVLSALLKRGKAELAVQLDRLAHLADVQRVGAQLIDRHDDPPEWLMASWQAAPEQTGVRRVVWPPRAVKGARELSSATRTATHRAPACPARLRLANLHAHPRRPGLGRAI